MAESEFKIVNHERESFTIIVNSVFQSKNLSLKSKGLLGYMLSLPKDWDYSIKGLVLKLKEGEKTIKSILNELEEQGYLIRKRDRIKGKFSVQYIVYSQSKNRSLKTPTVISQPQTQNHSLKTPAVQPYIQSTNNKVLKESVTHAENSVTLEEIKVLVQNQNLNINSSKVFYYLEARDFKSKGGQPVTSETLLNYLRQWESRNADYGQGQKNLNEKAPERVKDFLDSLTGWE